MPARALANVPEGVVTSVASTSMRTLREAKSARPSAAVDGAMTTRAASVAKASEGRKRTFSPVAVTSSPANGGVPAIAAFTCSAPVSVRGTAAGDSGTRSARRGASSVAVKESPAFADAARRDQRGGADSDVDRRIAQRRRGGGAMRMARQRNPGKEARGRDCDVARERAMRARARLTAMMVPSSLPAG